jgi:hypothetical protein
VDTCPSTSKIFQHICVSVLHIYTYNLDSALEGFSTQPLLHNVESMYGKLQHTMLVVPKGQAYLANLGADKDCYCGDEHVCCHLSHLMQSDLEWWQALLSQPVPAHDQPYAAKVHNCQAYSDASSTARISVWINTWWRAWRLCPGWKSKGWDIAWAEVIGFWLLL